MAKDDQLHIRLDTTDKERVKARLKEYGKPTSFLIDFFLKNTDDTKGSLEIEKIILLDELEELKELRKDLNYKIENKEIRLKAIENQLNNTTLYDLENYKYNKPIFNAVNSIKNVVIQREIKKYEGITDNIFKSNQQAYRVKDYDLLKNIVKNEFGKWLKEIELNNIIVETKEDFITDKANKIIERFKRPSQRVEDLEAFIETPEIQQVIQGYCNNYAKENPDTNEKVTPEEIINKVLEKKVKR